MSNLFRKFSHDVSSSNNDLYSPYQMQKRHKQSAHHLSQIQNKPSDPKPAKSKGSIDLDCSPTLQHLDDQFPTSCRGNNIKNHYYPFLSPRAPNSNNLSVNQSIKVSEMESYGLADIKIRSDGAGKAFRGSPKGKSGQKNSLNPLGVNSNQSSQLNNSGEEDLYFPNKDEVEEKLKAIVNKEEVRKKLLLNKIKYQDRLLSKSLSERSSYLLPIQVHDYGISQEDNRKSYLPEIQTPSKQKFKPVKCRKNNKFSTPMIISERDTIPVNVETYMDKFNIDCFLNQIHMDTGKIIELNTKEDGFAAAMTVVKKWEGQKESLLKRMKQTFEVKAGRF